MSKKVFMFNREKEVSFLKDILHNTPDGITVILGEPDTGKTAILSKVLSDELDAYDNPDNIKEILAHEPFENQARNFTVHIKPKIALASLDLRAMGGLSLDVLYDSLRRSVRNYYCILECVKEAEIKADAALIPSLSFKMNLDQKIISNLHINRLLNDIIRPLEEKGFDHKLPSVLAIDEANALLDLVEGNNSLQKQILSRES